MSLVNQRKDIKDVPGIGELLKNRTANNSKLNKPSSSRKNIKKLDAFFNIDDLIAQSNKDMEKKRMKQEAKNKPEPVIFVPTVKKIVRDEVDKSKPIIIEHADVKVNKSDFDKTEEIIIKTERSRFEFVEDGDFFPKIDRKDSNIFKFCSPELKNNFKTFILEAKENKMNFHDLLKVRKDGSVIKILKPRDHYMDYLMKQVRAMNIGIQKAKPIKKNNSIERNKIIDKVKRSFNKFTKNSSDTLVPKVCIIGNYKCGKSSIVGQILEKMGDLNENFIKSTKWAANKAECQQLEKAWLSDISNNDRLYKETIYPSYATITNAENNQICLIDCPGNKNYQDLIISELMHSNKIAWVINLEKDWSTKTKCFKNELYMITQLKLMKIFKITSLQIHFVILNPDKRYNTEFVVIELKKLILKYLKEKSVNSIDITSEFIYKLSNEDKDSIADMLWKNNHYTINEMLVNDKECLCIVKDIVKPVESKNAILFCEIRSGGVILNDNYDVFVPGKKNDKPMQLTIKQMKYTNGSDSNKRNRNEAFAGETIELTQAIVEDASGSFNCKEDTIKVGSIITNHYTDKNAIRDEISKIVMRVGHNWKVSLLILKELSNSSPIAPGVLFRFQLSSSNQAYVCRVGKVIDVSFEKEIKNSNADGSNRHVHVRNKVGMKVTMNLVILGHENNYENIAVQLKSEFRLDIFFLSELKKGNKIIGAGKIIEKIID